MARRFFKFEALRGRASAWLLGGLKRVGFASLNAEVETVVVPSQHVLGCRIVRCVRLVMEIARVAENKKPVSAAGGHADPLVRLGVEGAVSTMAKFGHGSGIL